MSLYDHSGCMYTAQEARFTSVLGNGTKYLDGSCCPIGSDKKAPKSNLLMHSSFNAVESQTDKEV